MPYMSIRLVIKVPYLDRGWSNGSYGFVEDGPAFDNEADAQAWVEKVHAQLDHNPNVTFEITEQ